MQARSPHEKAINVTRYANDNQRECNSRFDAEKNSAPESRRQAFSRYQNPIDATGYRYVEVHECHSHY